jgi:hypothetical protein
MEMQRSGGSLYGGCSHEADCKSLLPSKTQWSQIGFSDEDFVSPTRVFTWLTQERPIRDILEYESHLID